MPVAAKDITDNLGIPGPIKVGNKDYVLSWSSNPQPGYFKQEYLSSGANPQTYDSMVMVEFLTTDLPLNKVIAAQTAMINKRKATDPIANMAIFKNNKTGDVVLDFLLSSRDKNGEYIIEWNGYRYSEGKFKGKRGSVLFALSERAYGNEASKAFLQKLKDFKASRIHDLTNTAVPKFK
ncbi:hypothetical protein LQT97_12860 [Brucella pseudogrignonensis]|uniref:hypothetical protein n=1 Tax=Brucella pseudogrignonensis TaxID=419475 RepID=UPI001E5A2E4C|nr:hypothetical protein [Brucella pseudogrignonensis]MCD4512119.1 hypothetical protein [Brucella pseudogrignonensis]